MPPARVTEFRRFRSFKAVRRVGFFAVFQCRRVGSFAAAPSGAQSLVGIRPDSSLSHGEATCLPAPRKGLPRGPTPPRLRAWPTNGRPLSSRRRSLHDEVAWRAPDHAVRVLTFAMPAVYLGAARTGRSQFSEDLRGGCTRRTPLHRHGSRPRANARGEPGESSRMTKPARWSSPPDRPSSRHLPAAPRRPLATPGGRRSLERGPISRSSWRPGYWRALKWRNHGSR